MSLSLSLPKSPSANAEITAIVEENQLLERQRAELAAAARTSDGSPGDDGPDGSVAG